MDSDSRDFSRLSISSARPWMVGVANTSRILISTPNSAWTRAASCATANEWPPIEKKLS